MGHAFLRDIQEPTFVRTERDLLQLMVHRPIAIDGAGAVLLQMVLPVTYSSKYLIPGIWYVCTLVFLFSFFWLCYNNSFV